MFPIEALCRPTREHPSWVGRGWGRGNANAETPLTQPSPRKGERALAPTRPRGRLMIRLRQETPLYLQIAIPVGSVIVTLGVCAGFVALSGTDVIEAYRLLLFSTFESQ